MHAPQYQYAKGAVPQRPVVYYPVSLQRDNTRNMAVVYMYVHPEKTKKNYDTKKSKNGHKRGKRERNREEMKKNKERKEK